MNHMTEQRCYECNIISAQVQIDLVLKDNS